VGLRFREVLGYGGGGDGMRTGAAAERGAGLVETLMGEWKGMEWLEFGH